MSTNTIIRKNGCAVKYSESPLKLPNGEIVPFKIVGILQPDGVNDEVMCDFLKDVETPRDKISEDIRKLYRNVYTYSMIKIPSIIYNHLNCKTLDYIILDVKDNHILVNTQKRRELSEISALIKESWRE